MAIRRDNYGANDYAPHSLPEVFFKEDKEEGMNEDDKDRFVEDDGEVLRSLTGKCETGGDGDDLVREAAEASERHDRRFRTIEEATVNLQTRTEGLEETVKALQDAPKQPAPDKLKERFYFLKTEIDITQAAIDQLQTKVSMPNNFKLTSRDVSELVKMVEAGIAHITTCKKELDSTKGQLAERYVEQWRKKQAEIAEQAATGK